MAWFKQNEQKSPASPESQTSTPPAAVPAAPVQAAVAPVEQWNGPASPAPAVPVAAAGVPAASTASRVSRGITVRGEISGREDLSIDGEVEGTLRLGGVRVIIGATGRVRAGISAREIVVHGEVRGDVQAEERIEIGRTGKVKGNATAKRIAIEDGAVFNGTLEVLRADMVARSNDASRAARAGARAEARPDARADAKPETKADAKVDAKPETRPETRVGQQTAQPAAPAAPASASAAPKDADKSWRDETGIASDSVN